MSFEGKIKIDKYVVHFDYAYDRHEGLLLDSAWTAYDGDTEVQIPDIDLVDEIDEEIQKYLSRKNSDIGTDYNVGGY